MPAECRRIWGPSPLWPAFRKSPAPTRPCSYVVTSSWLVETIQASSVAHIVGAACLPRSGLGITVTVYPREGKSGSGLGAHTFTAAGTRTSQRCGRGGILSPSICRVLLWSFLTTSKNSWPWSLPFPPAEKPERKHFLEPRPGGLDGLADQLSQSFNLCVVWVCWKEPIVL